MPCLGGAALALLALFAGSVSGQSLFDPPPATDPPAARVRGLADPGESAAGPYQAVGADEGRPVDGAASGVTPTEAVPIDGAEVVARVDGQVILATDMLWQVNQLIANANAKQIAAGGPPLPDDQVEMAQKELMSRLLLGLIDTKLLYADFRRTVPAENMPKIDESIGKPFEEIEIPRLIEMLKVKDRTELDMALRKQGTSLKDVQRQFTEKTIASEWLKQRMPKPQPITYEALAAYYQDHPKEFEVPAEIDWEELAVRFDRCGGDRNEAWRQLCEMANEVYRTAQANPGVRGALFAAVAKAKSQGPTATNGGLYEKTSPGALKCDAINEALATLQVGQFSDGLESDVGFHIVRVLRRTEAGRRPFTEAQDQIRKLLESEQRMAALGAELKELRTSARVWTVFHGELNGPQVAALLEEKPSRR